MSETREQQARELAQSPYVCVDCAKLDKNWYASCPHAPAQNGERAAGEGKS